jgi:hypothetical protein
MAPRRDRHRRIAGGLALLVISWLALASGPAARGADSPVHYFAERKFEIPFSMSPERTFRQLHLHASTDGKNYSKVASTEKRQGAFEYEAVAGDGWYYFVVQIEEADGSLSPARVNLSQPSTRVCIDTQKPVVTLRPIQPRPPSSVAVEWNIQDPNLDLQTLRLEYRPMGGPQWTTLNILRLNPARFDWSPAVPGPFEVRLVVSDKAGNTAQATTQVRPDGSRAPAGAYAGPPPTGDRPVIHVNKKTFKLTYKLASVGPSNVKHVEVWQTRDTTLWTKLPGEAPPTGPHPITVPAAGRYGYTLRPISGVGRGPSPPRARDLPQVWVEVDEKPPVVKLHNVVVGEGTDSGKITVNWQANDDFLRDQPITIYYASRPEEDWKVLQEKVDNTGTCKCTVPEGLFEFYVRVEAVDRAGNKAHDQTRETVKVDLSVPEAKEINVEVGEPASRPPG